MNALTQDTSNYKWLDMKEAYKWDENSPLKFKRALESPDTFKLMEDCQKHINSGQIKEAGTILQVIFTTAADSCLEKETHNAKHKKNTKKKGKVRKKWFDKECHELKAAANRSAINKNKQPWNNAVRESHKRNLKDFKNICKTKKFNFWQKKITELDDLRG